jgi:hypothetical protein
MLWQGQGIGIFTTQVKTIGQHSSRIKRRNYAFGTQGTAQRNSETKEGFTP